MEDDYSLFLALAKKHRFEKESGEHKFYLINKKQYIIHKTNYIIDPAYDSTFKYLFGLEESKERLKDFITEKQFSVSSSLS